jgi:hypothetical protein
LSAPIALAKDVAECFPQSLEPQRPIICKLEHSRPSESLVQRRMEGSCALLMVDAAKSCCASAILRTGLARIRNGAVWANVTIWNLWWPPNELINASFLYRTPSTNGRRAIQAVVASTDTLPCPAPADWDVTCTTRRLQGWKEGYTRKLEHKNQRFVVGCGIEREILSKNFHQAQNTCSSHVAGLEACPSQMDRLKSPLW